MLTEIGSSPNRPPAFCLAPTRPSQVRASCWLGVSCAGACRHASRCEALVLLGARWAATEERGLRSETSIWHATSGESEGTHVHAHACTHTRAQARTHRRTCARVRAHIHTDT
eukprot:10801427-Alexandrium_andersonii.AAC.1